MNTKFIRFTFLLLLLIGLKDNVICQNSSIQDDSLQRFVLFKDRLILNGMSEFIIPPLVVNYLDLPTKKHLDYKINQGIILGIGGAYKGVSLNLSYMLIKHIDDVKKYGETRYLGLRLGIPIKRFYFEATASKFEGYALKKANIIIPNYPNGTLISPHLSNLFINVAASFFANKNFNFKAAEGKEGHYIKRLASLFYKVDLTGYFIGNKNESIIPHSLLIEQTNKELNANATGSYTLGLLPGLFYVVRFSNWQFSGTLAAGPGIQFKYYHTDEYFRNYFGLTPKFETKINFGYNPDDWFLILTNEVEYFHMKFTSIFIPSLFYNIKLTGGYRFKIKQKNQINSANKTKKHKFKL